MHIENRYDALIERHRRIEAKLAAELKRPLPDSLALQRLKREKLLVKDEIADECGARPTGPAIRGAAYLGRSWLSSGRPDP